ncbi:MULTISPECIES: ABC transporter ATP-binding protein [Mesorhizobium]|uniref:ABC transporter ATP-binding protein n=1 Tax=Mesorhizobium denitrificans TaxID=2294114 RepID=A0A371X968_9HYPH|nr:MULTISPECIES: ABC transporter ATP-binding protein [Mesorhizobium]RFC65775.1 ABC transporter ATP-binding protein [Mesorhizobium denitrificans]
MRHLDVVGLTVIYGAVRAVANMSIHLDEGETVALIGPNGAGKSSLLLTIAGVVPARSGSIKLRGEDIGSASVEQRVGSGISVVPETRDIFAKLSVHENLLIGASLRRDAAVVKTDIDRMYSLFPRLAERRKQMAGFLSGGEQQMLAIGRALMARPKLLMLDEPSLGLAPIITDKVYETIAELKKSGTSILLVEQNAERAFGVCDRAYIIQAGRVTLEGSPEELAKGGLVEQALFGRAAAGIVRTSPQVETAQ